MYSMYLLLEFFFPTFKLIFLSILSCYFPLQADIWCIHYIFNDLVNYEGLLVACRSVLICILSYFSLSVDIFLFFFDTQHILGVSTTCLCVFSFTICHKNLTSCKRKLLKCCEYPVLPSIMARCFEELTVKQESLVAFQ